MMEAVQKEFFWLLAHPLKAAYVDCFSWKVVVSCGIIQGVTKSWMKGYIGVGQYIFM